MIYGIGTDIEEVDRIKAVISGRERFLERFFSKSEREMFAERKMNPETICGNFCAKEAFVKALGTGFRKIALCEIEVLRDELGKPYFNFLGSLAMRVANMELTVHLSLSHTSETAVAFAVIETPDGITLPQPAGK